MPKTPAPRINHVAFSVPPDLLNETGRKEIVSFYEEVFGWKELEMLRIDRARVVLQCHRFDQFVYIVGGSPITTCAPLDHFGMAVGSLEELEGVLERAKKYRERDDRVEVVDHQVEDHGMLKLHKCCACKIFDRACIFSLRRPDMFESRFVHRPAGARARACTPIPSFQNA